VQADDEVKSVSNEMSFAVSLDNREDISRALATMAAKVCRRLRKSALKARTVTLKVRYENLKSRTAQTRLAEPTNDEFTIIDALEPLIDGLWTRGMLVRLVGVAASGFDDKDEMGFQDSLFDSGLDNGHDSSERQEKSRIAAKRAGLIAATDKIRDRFGERAVNYGRENATLGCTTGSGAKNPEDYRRA
jgi:DNA polymerase-4